MSTSGLAGLQAPVEYSEVQARLNTVRAIFGLALTVLAVSGILADVAPAPLVLVLGLYLAVDAIWRRTNGGSAIPVLLIDTVVVSAISLIKGDAALVDAVAFLYILTGALLLLRIPVATAVIGTALVLGIPIAIFAPIGDTGISATRELVFNGVVVASLTGIVATLLYGAVQALHASTERHHTALAAERRAVEVKDEFVSMVSHEFRTPLTSIAGFSETLRANWLDLDDEEIDEFLIIVRQEAHHLSSLVEDILVIPRIEAGQLRLRLQEFDLSAEIHATVRLVFADTGKEVNTAIPGGVMVKGDRGRTGQILRNLLDNARKYGGDAVQIEGEAGTDIYTVTIFDNGPGIAEEDGERIFEHFEQGSKGDSRSDEGVGLGLPIARKLARAMGGDVWYVPRFPTGATFCFSVQLSRIIADAPMPSEPIDADQPEFGNDEQLAGSDSASAPTDTNEPSAFN